MLPPDPLYDSLSATELPIESGMLDPAAPLSVATPEPTMEGLEAMGQEDLDLLTPEEQESLGMEPPALDPETGQPVAPVNVDHYINLAKDMEDKSSMVLLETTG